MLHLLNDDCIIQIAQELAYEHSGDLVPFVQTNRHLYNVASHCLLYCPPTRSTAVVTYSELHLGFEGDTSSDRRIEGFRDFVLGINSHRSRLGYLRKLVIVFPSPEDMEDIDRPRFSRRSIDALVQVFNPALHPRHEGVDPTPIALERLITLYRLHPPIDLMESFLPVTLLLLKLSSLWKFDFPTNLSTDFAAMHKQIEAPLEVVSLDIVGPDVAFEPCGALCALSHIKDTLRELWLDVRNSSSLMFTCYSEPATSPLYPRLTSVHLKATEICLRTIVLLAAMPNLKSLTFFDHDSVYRDHYHDSHLDFARDDLNPLFKCLRQINQEDVELHEFDQWTHLEQLRGPVRLLYSLGLTCKVDSLWLYCDGVEEHMVQELCEHARPKSLQFCCILARSLPSVTSAIDACDRSLKEFHLGTVVYIPTGNEKLPEEYWEDRRRHLVSTSV